MDRRRFLAALAATGVAGCQGLTDSDRPATTPQSDAGRADTGADGAATPTAGSLARHGYPPTVCSEPLPADPGIDAVTDPATAADWTDRAVPEPYRGAVDGADARAAESDGAAGLADDHTVVGLGTGERARAYPLAVLRVHEVVNDSVVLGDGRSTATPTGATPVAVTYCPLCNSGLVARRVVDGAATQFLVSGLLWQAPRLRSAAAERAGEVFGAGPGGATPAVRNSGNLVMVDRATGSYWSQILARAICGPERGARLEIVPSSVATWGEWRRANPGTDVLLPPPHSGTADPGAVRAAGD